MSKYRQAAKIDTNQPDIVKDLRKLGYSVEVNHDDILVGANNRTYWYEIKTPECRSKRTGEIKESCKKDDQKRLDREYRGHRKYATTTQEILDDLKPNDINLNHYVSNF